MLQIISIPKLAVNHLHHHLTQIYLIMFSKYQISPIKFQKPHHSKMISTSIYLTGVPLIQQQLAQIMLSMFFQAQTKQSNLLFQSQTQLTHHTQIKTIFQLTLITMFVLQDGLKETIIQQLVTSKENYTYSIPKPRNV